MFFAVSYPENRCHFSSVWPFDSAFFEGGKGLGQLYAKGHKTSKSGSVKLADKHLDNYTIIGQL